MAGTGVAQFEAKEKVRSSDIPGLVGRANNPLQFLGLYNTAHSACRRHDIPAIHVRFIHKIVRKDNLHSFLIVSITDIRRCQRRTNFNFGNCIPRSTHNVDKGKLILSIKQQ